MKRDLDADKCPPEALLSIRLAAQRMRVSAAILSEMIAAGIGPPIVYWGRSRELRIPCFALQPWLERLMSENDRRALKILRSGPR